MIAVDTNVLVRLLVNDDPAQSPRAAALFAAEEVFIAKTVLLETEWVLRFSYDLPREAVGVAFERLASVSSVTLEDAETVRAALSAHAAGIDFADALHVASARGAARFVTFDKKLGGQAVRAKLPVAVDVS